MSKLDEARERLHDLVLSVTDLPLRDKDMEEFEQSARDFAAAEISERYQRPRPPPGPDEYALTDDEWLRAGGFAKEVGDD